MNILQNNKQIVILAILNFLYCLGVYVTLPVLALYFHQDLGISIPEVGILLGIPTLVAAFSGSIGAVVSKKIGEMKCLIMAITITMLLYTMYIFASDYLHLLCISVASGFSRILWQPVIKSLFAHHASKLENQATVFRINYIVICLGAIFGPLLAMLLSDRHYNLMISIGIFALIIVMVLTTSTILQINGFERKTKPKASILKRKGVDRRLLIYITAGFLVYFVFAQFETVFSLSLKSVSQNPEMLFSILLIVNSLAGVVFQLGVMRFGKKLNSLVSLIGGNILFAIAFVVFAYSHGNIILLVLATLIFAMGEVFAIPGSDIVINDIAPDDKKTLYFSLAEFRILGFSLGPAFSSMILEKFGATTMFLSSVGVIILASVFYLIPKTSFFQSLSGIKDTRQVTPS